MDDLILAFTEVPFTNGEVTLPSEEGKARFTNGSIVSYYQSPSPNGTRLVET
jgi:hypothetical protein